MHKLQIELVGLNTQTHQGLDLKMEMHVLALSLVRRSHAVIKKPVKYIAIAIAIAIAILFYCFDRSEKSEFVFDGAKKLRKNISDNRVEYSYYLQEKYPASFVTDKMRDVLLREKYRMCKSLMDDWQSFIEVKSKKDIVKHNRQVVAVNKLSNTIAFVVFWYDFSVSEDLGVSIQFFSANDKKELADMLKYIDVEC